MKNGNKVRNICIDGPGGTGKSTLAKALITNGGFDTSSQLLHGDWYFERWQQGDPQYDPKVPGYFNSARFMQDIGVPLNQGNACTPRESVFLPDGASKLVEHPAPRTDQLTVIEGIKLLALPVDWDVKVWVDTPRAIRRERFMARTSAERKSESLDDPALRLQAFNHWADDAAEYEWEYNPEGREDVLVISGLASAVEQIALIQAFAAGR